MDAQRLHAEHMLVSFHVEDVYVPEPSQILRELHGRDLMSGRLIDFSDKGEEERAFAVVEVEGLRDPVVVPTAKLIIER